MDVNGTGAGHRITMISNVAKYLSIFEGLRSFRKVTLIASLRDYDLIFLFVLRHPTRITWPFLGNKWNNPRGASVHVYLIACI